MVETILYPDKIRNQYLSLMSLQNEDMRKIKLFILL